MASNSLLANIHKQSTFKMHYTHNGQIVSVTLSSDRLSIQQAIVQSIEKFNSQLSLELRQDVNMYNVYGARKSGKRKDDLPSFQKSQNLAHTSFKHFHLQPFKQTFKLKSKDSIKSIQTQISTDSCAKSETKQSQFFGCFFLRKGSMK